MPARPPRDAHRSPSVPAIIAAARRPANPRPPPRRRFGHGCSARSLAPELHPLGNAVGTQAAERIDTGGTTMSERDDPTTGQEAGSGNVAGDEVTARGYRHTPGNREGNDEAVAGQTGTGQAGTPGGGPETVDEFGADPGGRERFDAANAYGTDVDPDEMGGLTPPTRGPASR